MRNEKPYPSLSTVREIEKFAFDSNLDGNEHPRVLPLLQSELERASGRANGRVLVLSKGALVWGLPYAIQLIAYA